MTLCLMKGKNVQIFLLEYIHSQNFSTGKLSLFRIWFHFNSLVPGVVFTPCMILDVLKNQGALTTEMKKFCQGIVFVGLFLIHY